VEYNLSIDLPHGLSDEYRQVLPDYSVLNSVPYDFCETEHQHLRPVKRTWAGNEKAHVAVLQEMVSPGSAYPDCFFL
jgi:hypothetical protein